MSLLVNIWYFFTILLIIANIFAFLARFHFFFDLWSHFRVQYFLLGFSLIVSSFLIPPPSLSGGLLAFIILGSIGNLYFILPYLKFRKKRPIARASEMKSRCDKNDLCDLKILFSNIYRDNFKFANLFNQIDEKKPDVIAIVEFAEHHKKAFEALDKGYDYKFELVRLDGFGMAFYSKYPFEEIYRSIEMDIPFLIFKVSDPTKFFHIAILHPPPPIFKDWFEIFDFQLKELTEQISIQNLKNTIIAGDLNASVFGHFYKRFIKENNLLDPRKFFGLNLSWAKSTPFFLPIDHILTTKNFQFKQFEILNNVGSDHRSIFVEINLN